jgi:hypothetical protein
MLEVGLLSVFAQFGNRSVLVLEDSSSYTITLGTLRLRQHIFLTESEEVLTV